MSVSSPVWNTSALGDRRQEDAAVQASAPSAPAASRLLWVSSPVWKTSALVDRRQEAPAAQPYAASTSRIARAANCSDSWRTN